MSPMMYINKALIKAIVARIGQLAKCFKRICLVRAPKV